MVNLVTVVGHNTTMLSHMLEYYRPIVDNIYVVVYRQSDSDGILEEIESMGVVPYKVVTEPKFNWNKVTELYNEVKQTKPNEWWIVSDDDEFHVYPYELDTMIETSNENGWEFITGGFIDRIGERGKFPEVDLGTDIWQEFPLGGFFRYPMSGACPNKVCVMKGSVNVTPGQHYVDLGNGKNTWGIQGVDHPNRYPLEYGFVQVHHFKWDSTVVDRIKEVSETIQPYTHWSEYKKMYESIKDSNFKIDILNPEYYIEELNIPSYYDFSKWEELTDKIIRI